MRAYNYFIAVVATLALTTLVAAQYDEECHYECIQLYCDIFYDYCDYDCHEVCYPYRALKSHEQQLGVDGHRNVAVKGAGDQPVLQRHQWIRHNLKHEFETRHTGKVVRMRLNKSAAPVADPRTKTASGPTKGSPSVNGFALFQDCLSEKRTKEVHA